MTASTPITRFRPADAARQCEASFIDLGFVVACAGVAALISHDITVTAMIALEAVAVLAVGEGSRGITPGNMMLGLRTVRVEGMHDATAGVLPAGMGRILIKYCMLIASLLAAFVGLPIVMCSPLFSGNDLNQGWANRSISASPSSYRQGHRVNGSPWRMSRTHPYHGRWQEDHPRCLRSLCLLTPSRLRQRRRYRPCRYPSHRHRTSSSSSKTVPNNRSTSPPRWFSAAGPQHSNRKTPCSQCRTTPAPYRVAMHDLKSPRIICGSPI